MAIRFPSGYTPAVEYLRDERNSEEIRKTLKKITGNDWQIRIEELPPDPKTTRVESSNGKPTGAASKRNDLLQLPFIRAAVDVLGAQLMKVEDGFDPNPVRALAPVESEDDETVLPVSEPDES